MYSPQFQAGGTKIIGPAYTVKFVLKSDLNAPQLKKNYVRAPSMKGLELKTEY